MSKKEETLLEFINMFLLENSLPTIEKVTDFVVAKDLLLKSDNVRLFQSQLLDKMVKIFDTFDQVHHKAQSSIHYMIAVLNKLVCELSDSETVYKFVVGQQFRIICEKIKLATKNRYDIPWLRENCYSFFIKQDLLNDFMIISDVMSFFAVKKCLTASAFVILMSGFFVTSCLHKNLAFCFNMPLISTSNG